MLHGYYGGSTLHNYVRPSQPSSTMFCCSQNKVQYFQVLHALHFR